MPLTVDMEVPGGAATLAEALDAFLSSAWVAGLATACGCRKLCHLLRLGIHELGRRAVAV